MHIKEHKIEHLSDSELRFAFVERYANGIHLVANLYFGGETFLDYQKDLIQEFLANYLDHLKVENYDLLNIKSEFEIALQQLNTKLKLFADKVTNVEYFSIKGYLQMIVDNTLISTMIGDVNLMIFRDNNLFYSLHNSTSQKGKIDMFSDFVEGELEVGDEIIYVGAKISDVLDDQDLRDSEAILASGEAVYGFFDEILSARMAPMSFGFINHYAVSHLDLQLSKRQARALHSPASTHHTPRRKKELFANKYYLTFTILGAVVLFMLYQVLSGLLKQEEHDVYVSASGEQVDVTIEDIKKDVYMFQSLDPTSDEKGAKYHEIMQKLDMLESKGRRLEDVTQLRTILQSDYQKGFNIIYINNLTQFDDSASGIKSQLLSFNEAEKQKLGEVRTLERGNNLYIGGTQGAMISAINDNMRGSLFGYTSETLVDSCSTNLLKDGLYCFDTNGNIFSVTKAGIEPVSTTDDGGFARPSADVKVFGKSNMYIFNPSLDDGVLLTRYRNVVGSQTQFQDGLGYRVVVNSGENLSGFSTFAIDSSFLAWGGGKLYQFWREEASSNLLETREIPLMGGDKMTATYSDDVKILSTMNSRYVYIFDKANQHFTVYESRPLKTNDAFSSEYSLYYLFRFSFDLENNKVADVTIPEETGERPEIYLLTNLGINKINLYDFIDSIKENNSLKTTE